MTWNGYGLSMWRCKCGAMRAVTHYTIVGGEAISEAHAKPCKRCGTEDNPTICEGDPWVSMDDGYAEDPLGGSWL
jgi:hypothetical protein